MSALLMMHRYVECSVLMEACYLSVSELMLSLLMQHNKRSVLLSSTAITICLHYVLHLIAFTTLFDPSGHQTNKWAGVCAASPSFSSEHRVVFRSEQKVLHMELSRMFIRAPAAQSPALRTHYFIIMAGHSQYCPSLQPHGGGGNTGERLMKNTGLFTPTNSHVGGGGVCFS